MIAPARIFSRVRCPRLWAFVVMALMMMIKCCLFDRLTLEYAFTNIDFWISISLLAKLSLSLLAASLVWVTRRYWPVLVLALVFDIWFITNMFYFEANHLFITFNVIKMATNLNGFTSSLLGLLSWKIWIWPLLTLLVVPFLCLLPSTPRRPWALAASLLLSAGLSLYASRLHVDCLRERLEEPFEVTVEYFDPLVLPPAAQPSPSDLHRIELLYIERHSLPAYLFYVCRRSVTCYREEQALRAQPWPDTDEQRALLAHAFRPAGTDPAPTGHLVLILVESLNSWALDEKDLDGEYVMPCLNRYIASHSLFTTRAMQTQVRHGCSGDGQMMLNTGICPLIDGAACILYGGNAFPNLAHFYGDGCVVSPWPLVWNQNVVSFTYGYRHLYEPEIGACEWLDDVIIARLQQECAAATVPSCMMGITVSTHIPYHRARNCDISLPDYEAPWVGDYLRCCHFVDSCIGSFLCWADTADCMRDATIAIMADHCSQSVHLGLNDTPFIVRSPSITANCSYDSCYQMDMFPTLLHAIGQDHYFWRGFGIDLLTETEDSRCFTPDEALYYSDRMLRIDYFNQ